jgi:hypothetical protein
MAGRRCTWRLRTATTRWCRRCSRTTQQSTRSRIDGWTALHLAAQNGHNEVVQTLLKNNAAIDEKQKDGFTALHFAAQNGHNEVVQTLLKNNAAIDEKTNNGETALQIAQRKGRLMLWPRWRHAKREHRPAPQTPQRRTRLPRATSSGASRACRTNSRRCRWRSPRNNRALVELRAAVAQLVARVAANATPVADEQCKRRGEPASD